MSAGDRAAATLSSAHARNTRLVISTLMVAVFIWLCTFWFGGSGLRADEMDSQPERAASAPGRAACASSSAEDFFKHLIAYERTGEANPFRGLPVIHLDVWVSGPFTAFYIRERLHNFVPGIRMLYLFGTDGLSGGGTCPVEENWRKCVAKFAPKQAVLYVATTCAGTIDLRSIPPWKPSPDDQKKRQIGDELRREIEAQWPAAREIVINDFNLKDNEITIYLKLPDGEYFQGCGFRATGEPHCVNWHLFGQAPLSSLRKWIFERPYRLK